MFLTRFRLNPARGGARKLLSSPQAMHAAVMSSFAEPEPRLPDGRRPLWRVDRTSRAEVLLYLVSPHRPDLTHLVEQAGWPTTGTWDTFDYAGFLGRLEKGQTWGFRLTANPVHSIRRTPDEPTKPTAHIGPRHQTGWLLRRQESGGFRVVEREAASGELAEADRHEVAVRGMDNLRFGKRDRPGPRGGEGKRRQVTLVTATFDGRLHVTDPQALRRTLTTGIGRARAYGCGLMTLAPVPVTEGKGT